LSKRAALGVVATLAVGRLLAAEPTQPNTNVESAKSAPAAHATDNSFHWPEWISKPPFGITWLSLFGGLGAFIWKAYEYWEKRRDRSEDHQLETDAFWYQAIVVEQILRPLLEFMHDESVEFAAVVANAPNADAAKDPFHDYKNTFEKDYASLSARMDLLQVVSKETLRSVMAALDNLEDAVALTCHEASTARKGERPAGKWTPSRLTAAFATTQVECVTHLKRLHESLSMPHRHKSSPAA
jgi:hypothetical protein